MTVRTPPTLVLIPARGERETLAQVVDGLPHELNADVVVLDGGGNGAPSWRRPGVEVRQVPKGNGVAVRAGLRLAVERGHHRVLRLDGDGQHDPNLTHLLLGGLEEADMVLGTRFGTGADLEGVPLDRLLLNVAFRDLVSSITGIHHEDVVSGCWALRREAFVPLHDQLTTDGYGTTIEMLVRLLHDNRATLAQVPIPAVYSGSARMRTKYDPAAATQRNQRAADYLTVMTRVLTDLGISPTIVGERLAHV